MSVLCDKDLLHRIVAGMIEPFVLGQVREAEEEKIISYGLGAGGYDIRLGNEFYEPDMADETIDPKRHRIVKVADDGRANDPFYLPANSYILGKSMETFDIPTNIIGICVGKSTYARCGILINVTPLEPGWKGVLTIEISNTGRQGVLLYPGEGIAQIIFHPLTSDSLVSYAEKGGKYMNQTGVTGARM